MSKDGFRIFDANCHVNEPPEAMEKCIERPLLESLRKWGQTGVRTYRPNQIGLRRRLGSAPGEDDSKPVAKAPHAARHRYPA